MRVCSGQCTCYSCKDCIVRSRVSHAPCTAPGPGSFDVRVLLHPHGYSVARHFRRLPDLALTFWCTYQSTILWLVRPRYSGEGVGWGTRSGSSLAILRGAPGRENRGGQVGPPTGEWAQNRPRTPSRRARPGPGKHRRPPPAWTSLFQLGAVLKAKVGWRIQPGPAALAGWTALGMCTLAPRGPGAALLALGTVLADSSAAVDVCKRV